jgi:separase
MTFHWVARFLYWSFCLTLPGFISGQLYCKQQLWDKTDSELKYARNYLAENDAFISCKLCSLTLDISLDMKDGDFQEQLTGNLSSALCMYQSAIEKLDNTQFLEGISNCHKPGCDKDCIAKTKCGAYNHGKEPLSAKDDVLPTCIICVLLRQASIDHCDEQAILNSRTKNSEARPPLDSEVKSGSRYPLCSAKEQNVETRVKTSELSSKQFAHGKGENVLTEINCKKDVSWNNELPFDALISGKASCYLDGIDCSKDDICDMIGCWNCLFIKSLYSCSIQNILQFRVNCVRRRYLLPLLLKRGPLFLVYVLCYMCSCGIIISHEGYHLA